MDNHPTDFAEYAEFLKQNIPEVVEEFEQGWEEPAYAENTCLRCGSLVLPENRGRHNFYHKNLSLALYALGAGMRSLINELGGVDERRSDQTGNEDS